MTMVTYLGVFLHLLKISFRIFITSACYTFTVLKISLLLLFFGKKYNVNKHSFFFTPLYYFYSSFTKKPKTTSKQTKIFSDFYMPVTKSDVWDSRINKLLTVLCFPGGDITT